MTSGKLRLNSIETFVVSRVPLKAPLTVAMGMWSGGMEGTENCEDLGTWRGDFCSLGFHEMWVMMAAVED